MKTILWYLALLSVVLAACAPQVTSATTSTAGNEAAATSVTPSSSMPSGEPVIELLGLNTALVVGESKAFRLSTHCGVDLLWINAQAWRPDFKDPGIEAWNRSVPDGWNVDLSDPATTVVATLSLIDTSTLTATAGDPPLTITYRPDTSVSTPPMCD